MSDFQKSKQVYDDKKVFFVIHTNLAIGMYKEDEIFYRIRLFEKLALKSIKSQTFRNYSIAIYIDKKWPDSCKKTLKYLLQDAPFAEVAEVDRINETFNKRIIQIPEHAEYIAHLRMDDDDLIHNDYLLLAARASVSNLRRENGPRFVYLYSSSGYLFFPDINRFGSVSTHRWPLAIAIGAVHRANDNAPSTPAHHEIFEKLGKSNDFMIFDLGVFGEMWAYTRHRRSDSNREGWMMKLISDFSEIGLDDGQKIFEFGLSKQDYIELNAELKNTPSSTFFASNDPQKKRLTMLWELDNAKRELLYKKDISSEELEKKLSDLDRTRSSLE